MSSLQIQTQLFGRPARFAVMNITTRVLHERRRGCSLIIHDGVSPLIVLKNGIQTRIDDDFVDEACRHTWFFSGKPGRPDAYVRRHSGRGYLRLHRLVMDAGPDEIVDHINGDMLDNRAVNLRLCTRTQNAQNRKPNRNTSSQYKGCSFRRGWWHGRIDKADKGFYLGRFATEAEAARAYDDAARKMFGEFARLNFPEARS